MICPETRIVNAVEWYKHKRSDYKNFADLISRKVLSAIEQRSILLAFHSVRAKTVDSYEKKCRKQVLNGATNEYVYKYSDPQNQIMDNAGVRIVTYLQSDVSSIKEIIEKIFDIDWENSQDKLDLLESDKVGYLSIHYIVSLKECSYEERLYKDFKCEIQLRTILQDAWAQIFHDRQYKTNSNVQILPDELKRGTSLVAGALELVDQQIGQLVAEYDRLSGMNKVAEYQKLLDAEINAETIVSYFVYKFGEKATRYYNSRDCIELLEKFEFKTVRELDNVITDAFVNAIKTTATQMTIDKLLTYILIIYDSFKFFSLDAKKFAEISVDSFEFLGMFVDIEKICKDNSITVI